MRTLIRLDKYLADMGLGTRSQVKNDIKKGCVSVNGAIVRNSDCKIDEKNSTVTYDGKDIPYVDLEYYMLNKPHGIVSATTDNYYRTVIDLIDNKVRKDLFPVGRLDIDTEGLLIITNDGKLSHELLSPRKHVDKVYYVELDKVIPENIETLFAQGIELEKNLITKPAKLVRKSKKSCELTIHEGKFHQVKRMFEKVGLKVIYLKRLSMGNLTLDEKLKPGEYRKLTDRELSLLKNNQ